MRKILVLIPSGEVYEHNKVRAYDHDQVRQTINRYYNLGDLFVFDSSLKLLDYDDVQTLPIDRFDPHMVDHINEEYQYCFLRGSNYLHQHMDWEHAESVLKQLRIPVIPFGIGVQAADGRPELSNISKRVMRRMAESCALVGVRGARTAEVLSELGIRNIEIIGCPSMFRHNNPHLEIRLKPLEEIRKVAFSLRREVDENYTRNVANYLKQQRELILALDHRFDLGIMAQGEIEEKVIHYDFAPMMDAAIHSLIEQGWIAGNDDPMMTIYRERMFFSERVEDYDAFVRTQDLTVGFRLHGNVMALASGIPAIGCVYDSRTREYAETLALPVHDIDSCKDFVLEEYYNQARFDRFNQRYKYCYGVMREFLNKNNMANTMQVMEEAA